MEKTLEDKPLEQQAESILEETDGRWDEMNNAIQRHISPIRDTIEYLHTVLDNDEVYFDPIHAVRLREGKNSLPIDKQVSPGTSSRSFDMSVEIEDLSKHVQELEKIQEYIDEREDSGIQTQHGENELERVLEEIYEEREEQAGSSPLRGGENGETVLDIELLAQREKNLYDKEIVDQNIDRIKGSIESTSWADAISILPTLSDHANKAPSLASEEIEAIFEVFDFKNRGDKYLPPEPDYEIARQLLKKFIQDYKRKRTEFWGPETQGEKEERENEISSPEYDFQIFDREFSPSYKSVISKVADMHRSYDIDLDTVRGAFYKAWAEEMSLHPDERDEELISDLNYCGFDDLVESFQAYIRSDENSGKGKGNKQELETILYDGIHLAEEA